MYGTAQTQIQAQAQTLGADGVSVDAVKAMVPGVPEMPTMPVDPVKAGLAAAENETPPAGCFSCFGNVQKVKEYSCTMYLSDISFLSLCEAASYG